MRSASRSSSVLRRANMATLAPALSSASAIARPSPEEAPQTIAVLLRRSSSSIAERILPKTGPGARRQPAADVEEALDLGEAGRGRKHDLVEHGAHDLFLEDLLLSERGQVVAQRLQLEQRLVRNVADD